MKKHSEFVVDLPLTLNKSLYLILLMKMLKAGIISDEQYYKLHVVWSHTMGAPRGYGDTTHVFLDMLSH